ncbi:MULTISPECIES: DUF3016 domain-containing protein [unclassified Methylobacterium]|uniref:DUF3016 domain-containing protein n=1 Tax=unclassified Methylobacterium TaxID=2615210 RepID=UPI0007000EFC|nr:MULTISPECIES: DUF3016 domain-containing protein [unclassified Methylobacterium]KQO49980.1 hypothetical protein ASF24_23390 [Methylobacterium sp. Leaf86]KQO84771.1 hypothetical protein ASF32_11880 [Methylobacterium sp. Leaf91]
MQAALVKLALVLIGFAGSAIAAPGGSVEIRFIEPDRFVDANNRFSPGIGPQATLTELRRLMEQSASPYLAPGERLVIDVLDVDLAGFPNPGANFPYGLRVVTDATPPSFRLRYSLLNQRGQRIATNDERVSDINFLLGARTTQAGSFPYERELLREWARRRFANRSQRAQ